MFIEAKTISEAWFYALYNIDSPEVYKQIITKGSFEHESFRLQYPQLAISIDYPLMDMIPTVPEGTSSPSSIDYVKNYFTDYILEGKKPEKNEEYTYASRMGDQLFKAMAILEAHGGGSNHAVIEIGIPGDLDLDDPSCMRVIDLKVVNDSLCLGVYFRSNDLWAGFPVNLGGLAKLQEMIAEYIGKEVGKMYYHSCGAHIYEYQIPYVEGKIGKKIIY
jgi:thymidylate synthase